jgi:hypothetical protein
MSKGKNTTNYHTVGGTIFSIGVPRNVTKDPSKNPFYVMEVIVEIRETVRGNSRSTFLSFELKDKSEIGEGFRLFDRYEEGDEVIITFKADGVWKAPVDGERVFTSLKPVSVERVERDIDYSQEELDLIAKPPKKETKEEDYSEHIVPPDLLDDSALEMDDDEDGLPFMLTIPIAIGTLLSFMVF